MKERLTKILKSRITASIIYILLGLCLAFMPVTTVYIIYKLIFGVVMIAVGVYHIYTYLKDTQDATLLNMFSGSILVVLGGFLFFNPQIVVKLLPMVLGTFVLVDSVWSLQAAFRLKKKDLSAWMFLFAGSLVFVVLSLVAMLNPFREVKYTIFFSGCMLLGNGAADVIYLLLIRYWKKTISPKEEVVESGYMEEVLTGEVQDAAEEVPVEQPGQQDAEEASEESGSAQEDFTDGNAGEAVEEEQINPESGKEPEETPAEDPGSGEGPEPVPDPEVPGKDPAEEEETLEEWI